MWNTTSTSAFLVRSGSRLLSRSTIGIFISLYCLRQGSRRVELIAAAIRFPLQHRFASADLGLGPLAGLTLSEDDIDVRLLGAFVDALRRGDEELVRQRLHQHCVQRLVGGESVRHRMGQREGGDRGTSNPIFCQFEALGSVAGVRAR